MRVHLLGGFLGAGKTTIARTLARRLRDAGERPVVITNDQGRLLVDTQLCRDVELHVDEIGGGCFCCRYPELENALAAAKRAGATTAIAEAVGSCADIVATVLAPLADRHGGQYDLAPFTVVVDPWRVADAESGALSPDVAYLFRKQIEEADVVLLSRADLSPPNVAATIASWHPGAVILPVAASTGAGFDAWLQVTHAPGAPTLTIDYDRYASAESQLAWFNGVVRVKRNGAPLDPAALMRAFFAELSAAPVAHVKIAGLPPLRCWGALVRAGAAPVIDVDQFPESSSEFAALVNARVAMPPAELHALLRRAIQTAAGSAAVEWESVECFSPARPVPTHRYAKRCATGAEGSCCTAFYQRDDVMRLLGGSFHPGGVALTRQVVAALEVGPGGTVLDVACGTGESLRSILESGNLRGIGIDAGATPTAEPALELRIGDAHAIPLDSASVDAVLCECALSTFVDQPGALREMHRVLRSGRRVAITDMVLEGDVPDALREWVHSGTCLERALSARAYTRALEDSGFRIVRSWNASDALRELLLRIKRNLVGWVAAGASGAASVPQFNLREARQTLRAAEAAVNAGIIQYGVFIAEKPVIAAGP